MSNISPIIQGRVRQLLGLTGGLEIEPIEAVQPVVIVAGAQDQRQPQLESGDMLVRRWQGGMSRAASPGNYSAVCCRATEPRSVIWIQRLFITNDTAAVVGVRYGRGPNQTAAAWGSAIYTDGRLSGGNLSPALVEIHSATPALDPITYGGCLLRVPQASTLIIPVDFILVYSNSEGVNVVTTALNTELSFVTFEGVAYSKPDVP